MLKLTLSYLAGALTVAAAVYAAGGRATIAAFGIGFFLACVVAVALLSSARRMRRAARFLFAFAAALDRTGRTHRPQIVKPIRKPAAEPEPEASARAAARKAPNGTIEDVLKIALEARKAA